ncbi:MAG: type II toxin-antitoxin system HicA family toxin [Thermotoga caldifontis]
MIEFLQKMGFFVVRVHGSHHVLKNAKGTTVVVPVHSNETLGIGIIRKILNQAEIDVKDFSDYFSH